MRHGTYPSASGSSAPTDETNCVHQQRVTLPVPDGMAVDGPHEMLRIRMFSSIQIDMAHEGVDFGNQRDLILRLCDIPCRRMLHEKRVSVGKTPFRRERHYIATGLGRRHSLRFLDYFRFYCRLRDSCKRAGEIAPADFVLAFPESRQIRYGFRGRGLR